MVRKTMTEDDRPRPKANENALGADLSSLAIAELEARIEALRAEIARTEAEIAKKKAQVSAAASLFK